MDVSVQTETRNSRAGRGLRQGGASGRAGPPPRCCKFQCLDRKTVAAEHEGQSHRESSILLFLSRETESWSLVSDSDSQTPKNNRQAGRQQQCLFTYWMKRGNNQSCALRRATRRSNEVNTVCPTRVARSRFHMVSEV